MGASRHRHLARYSPRAALGALCVVALLMPGALLGEGLDEAVARAMQIFSEGDVVGAMMMLQPAAESGHPGAQVRLAYILDRARDYQGALHWYRAAAEAGDPEGAFGLAAMLAAGEGTPPDPTEAGQWMEWAAQGGHLRAMLALAGAHERGGLGREVDPIRALSWYRQAAQRGDRQARQRLAQAYMNGELGLEPDAQAAEAWLSDGTTDSGADTGARQ